jgi:hypothetical protein
VTARENVTKCEIECESRKRDTTQRKHEQDYSKKLYKASANASVSKTAAENFTKQVQPRLQKLCRGTVVEEIVEKRGQNES